MSVQVRSTLVDRNAVRLRPARSLDSIAPPWVSRVAFKNTEPFSNRPFGQPASQKMGDDLSRPFSKPSSLKADEGKQAHQGV